MEHRTELGQGRWIAAELAGEGPAVLLLHGIPGAGAVWRAVIAELKGEHRVIVPDLVGFGRSSRSLDGGALWADAQADAVLALLEHLGVRSVVAVGHDFGGPVAAHLVARAPARVSGLVLVSANAFGDTPVPFPLSGILWPVLGKAWERALFSARSLRMMVRLGVGADAPTLDPAVYVGDRAQAAAIRAIFTVALRELATRYRPVTEALRGVTVPTSVVWGDRDPFFPATQAHRTAGLIRGAEVTVLPGAGHFLPEERPGQLAEAVRAVCRRVERR
jgi:pimeloyl-ACP methyl ester carboxylesterase